MKRENYFGAAVATDASVDWRSSGLGVKMLVPGEGLSPQFSDQVQVHYTVQLKNNTVVDGSRAIVRMGCVYFVR